MIYYSAGPNEHYFFPIYFSFTGDSTRMAHHSAIFVLQ